MIKTLFNTTIFPKFITSNIQSKRNSLVNNISNNLSNFSKDSFELQNKSIKQTDQISFKGLSCFFSKETYITLVKHYFSELYEKELTQSEAREMIARYKEIFAINNREEFLTRIFNEIKRNFGYENVDIKLEIDKAKTPKEFINTPFAGTSLDIIRITQPCYSDFQWRHISKAEKEAVFIALHHEFTHVRQDEYMYRTNPDEYTKIHARKIIPLIENPTEEFLADLEPDELALFYKDKNEFTEYALSEIAKITKRKLDSIYDDKRFLPDSKEYQRGEEYLKIYNEYEIYYRRKPKQGEEKEKYMSDMLEQEAYAAGDNASVIFNFIG